MYLASKNPKKRGWLRELPGWKGGVLFRGKKNQFEMTSLMAFFIVFFEMTLISCVCLDDLFPVVLRLSHLGMKKERHCQYRVLDPCAVPPPPPLLITSSLGWKKTSTITNIIRNCHYKPCSQRLTFCRQTLTINDFQWKTVQKLLTLKRSLILHERVSLCLAIAELFPAHY